MGTTTRCERHGQVEIGIIEHEGREFSAFGATVDGRQITAYTQKRKNYITLTTWCGKTILDCRYEVESCWNGSLVLLFRLTHGRWIIGYALGEHGMLFRGELLDGYEIHEARLHARMLADCFAELDAEDDMAME